MTCLCFVDLVAFVGTAMLLAAAAAVVVDAAAAVVDAAAAVDVAAAEPGKDESSGKNRKIH